MNNYLKVGIFLLLISASGLRAQMTIVTGKVIDKETKEPMPFANLVFKGTKTGATTDINGNYKIETYYASDSLIASFIGYVPQAKKIKKDIKQVVNFELSTSSVIMEEFVVKYKGNPAEDLLEKVIQNKKVNNREKFSYYNYKVYNKVEFDLNNIDDEFKNRKVFKPIQFIFDNIDTTAEKPYLPMFISESLSEYFYRQSPKTQREFIKATKVSGINNESVSQFLGDMYQNVNIYDNHVLVFGKTFVSPVANFGLRYYKYYLTDSTFIDNQWCYKLEFRPRHRQEPVFDGVMWIHDTTYAIKKIDLKIAEKTNINFVNDFSVSQEYALVDGQFWMLSKDKLVVDFEINKRRMGLYGRKTTMYKDIRVNDSIPENIFSGVDDIIVSQDANKFDNAYWNENRFEKLSEQEKEIYHMIDTLKEVPAVKTLIDIASMILTGYKEFGKVELGQYFTFLSYNQVEGTRFKFGGRTSNKFARWLEFSGYAAYGVEDEEMKYGGGFRLRLSKEPRQIISFNYKNDLEQLGQSQNAFQADNFLASFMRRSPNIKLTMIEKYHFVYDRDWFQGFNNQLIYSNRKLSPRGSLTYTENSTGEIKNVPFIQTSELSYYVRFAYKEKYVSGEFSRVSMGTKYPIFEAQYTRGIRNFLSGQFNYDKIEVSVKDRFRFGTKGYLDWKILGGKIYGALPYPLLELHQGNETYFYDVYAFNLMNFFEFASDQYATLMLTHHFDGFFLNKMPLFRKLKWREVASGKAVIGTLDKSRHEAIMLLPDNMFELADPYAEVAVGVENIFRIFRIDLLWRMTHHHHPNIAKYGIRGTFEIKF